MNCLLAVHILDGILTWPWLAGGFVLAAVLAFIGAWRIEEEEIPRVALLTAVFFVASSIHIRTPPTSVHLLLNGLLGILLGWRAALAIPTGLLLQATLLGHGGFTTLGVNSCVMTLPALVVRYLFLLVHGRDWLRQSWFRGLLVALASSSWLLSLAYGSVLVVANGQFADMLVKLQDRLPAKWTSSAPPSATPMEWANAFAFQPLMLFLIGILTVLFVWLEQRMKNAPEFAVGLLLGEVGVLATIALNAIVLAWGGQESWDELAELVFVAHLPVAAIEGIVLGFTLGFLARVKPEMLRPAVHEQPVR